MIMQIYVEVLFHMKYCLCWNKVPLLSHLQYHRTLQSTCPSIFTRLTDSITMSDKRSSSFHLQNTRVKQTPVNANTSCVHTPCIHKHSLHFLLLEFWLKDRLYEVLEGFQGYLTIPITWSCSFFSCELHGKVNTMLQGLDTWRWLSENKVVRRRLGPYPLPFSK